MTPLQHVPMHIVETVMEVHQRKQGESKHWSVQFTWQSEQGVFGKSVGGIFLQAIPPPLPPIDTTPLP